MFSTATRFPKTQIQNRGKKLEPHIFKPSSSTTKLTSASRLPIDKIDRTQALKAQYHQNMNKFHKRAISTPDITSSFKKMPNYSVNEEVLTETPIFSLHQ